MGECHVVICGDEKRGVEPRSVIISIGLDEILRELRKHLLGSGIQGVVHTVPWSGFTFSKSITILCSTFEDLRRATA